MFIFDLVLLINIIDWGGGAASVRIFLRKKTLGYFYLFSQTFGVVCTKLPH